MNETAAHIRKQVYELTEVDLVTCPLWEFCSDEEEVEGQDEATVRPSLDNEVPRYSPGAYIVAADVLFANGDRGISYIYSGEPEDYACLQPNLLADRQQVSLWFGSLPLALAANFRAIYPRDEQGISVHVIHDANLSGCFPQYMIPRFLFEERFSHIEKFLVPDAL